jgi:peptide/nickel transport system substrate-binding protein
LWKQVNGTVSVSALIVFIMTVGTTITVYATACIAAVGAEEATPVLRIGVVGGMDTLNPFTARDALSLAVVSKVYEPLVVRGSGGEILPWLASFETPDAGTIRFRVVEGAVWHDGKAVTAEDVAFTISTIISPQYRARLDRFGLGGLISSVAVRDTRTVDISHRGEPYKLLYLLTQVPITPKQYFANTDPADFKNPSPIGSGPYLFKGLLEGAVVELNPFTGYRTKPKTNISLLIKPYPSARELASALNRGEVEMVEGLPFGPQDMALLTRGDVTAVSVGGEALLAIFFNVKMGPTADPALRRAIYAALDLKELVQKVAEGGETLGFEMVSRKHIWDWVGGTVEKVGNLTEALSILSSAGYSFGEGRAVTTPLGSPLTLRILVDADRQARVVADHLEDTLKRVGIGVKRIEGDPSTIGSLYTTGEYELAVMKVPYHDLIEDVYRSMLIYYGQSNWSRYQDKTVENLVSRLAATVEPNERLRLIASIGEVVRRDLPLIPLTAPVKLTAYRGDRISGVLPWGPSSLQSLIKLDVVGGVRVLLERVTVTSLVMTYQTVTRLSTTTLVVEKPVEIAPPWAYAGFVAAALMSSLFLLTMVTYAVRERRTRREEI